jgi:hypothetical protein
MIDLRAIETVTICSSSKFYADAQVLAKELANRGLRVYTPRFDFNEELVEVTTGEKINLTHEFLAKVQRSDAIYVIDVDGYTGRSVCIEVGYASALNKIVILSEPPIEGAIDALKDAVISTGDFIRQIRP